ncbi:hypothetical protein, partial [Gottfriedia acidiceleris]|uniref:hypothetical protein n=1 Tax=Gottfriedia acidiceleris TaxID=371036 RepID=UPI003D1D45D1
MVFAAVTLMVFAAVAFMVFAAVTFMVFIAVTFMFVGMISSFLIFFAATININIHRNTAITFLFATIAFLVF